jgi:hypothetical protein
VGAGARRNADYKEKVIGPRMRVTRVSVHTQATVKAMNSILCC